MASSSAVPRTVRSKHRPTPDVRSQPPTDATPLTRSQIREIERRIRDVDDRTRYLLVSVFAPRFALYYDVSNDLFAMNEPFSATLFKRKSAARAIQRLLRNHVEVVRCRVDRRNRLIKK